MKKEHIETGTPGQTVQSAFQRTERCEKGEPQQKDNQSKTKAIRRKSTYAKHNKH